MLLLGVFTRLCPNCTRHDHLYCCLFKLLKIQPSELIVRHQGCEDRCWHLAMGTGATNVTRKAHIARVPRFTSPPSRSCAADSLQVTSEGKSAVSMGRERRASLGREGKPSARSPSTRCQLWVIYISIYVGINNNKSLLDSLPGAMALKLTSQECLLICLEIFIPCILFLTISGEQHSNKCSYIWSDT